MASSPYITSSQSNHRMHSYIYSDCSQSKDRIKSCSVYSSVLRLRVVASIQCSLETESLLVYILPLRLRVVVSIKFSYQWMYVQRGRFILLRKHLVQIPVYGQLISLPDTSLLIYCLRINTRAASREQVHPNKCSGFAEHYFKFIYKQIYICIYIHTLAVESWNLGRFTYGMQVSYVYMQVWYTGMHIAYTIYIYIIINKKLSRGVDLIFLLKTEKSCLIIGVSDLVRHYQMLRKYFYVSKY